MAAVRQPTNRTKRRRSRRSTPMQFALQVAFVMLKIAILLAGITAIALLLIYRYYSQDLPDPAGIGSYRPAETTRIYARDGITLLYELVDPQGGRRTVVPLDQMPLSLKQATIALEDAGFYENPGVDIRGIIRAFWQNYEAGEVVSGASTITQQLVRNVLLPPSERASQSFERKLREAILAIQVSREYSKDQILSLYLNEVYYGNQAYGVEAAAQTYFGKHVWELNPAEATLIAGLPQSPTMLDPFTYPAAMAMWMNRQQLSLRLRNCA
jgi:membrane carboxypeptidase/penicillin-binding protein